jgi:hypothetical protein
VGPSASLNIIISVNFDSNFALQIVAAGTCTSQYRTDTDVYK